MPKKNKRVTQDIEGKDCAGSKLEAIRDRILVECALEKEGRGIMKRLQGLAEDDPREEPLRGCCHGLPGTGKSRIIK